MKMTEVLFQNNEEVLDKLKLLGILSKTKTINDLSTITYKKLLSNNNVDSIPCTILGSNYKENPDTCINKSYENLIIKVNDDIFNINPEYLKDMQAKSWGLKDEISTINLELTPPSDEIGTFAHLVTGPRKGIIVKLKNTKMTVPVDQLETAITKGFNKVTKNNYSKEYVMNNYYANTYDKIEYKEDKTSFNLIKDLSECSLNHPTKNYTFVEENISVGEYERIIAIDFETANSKRASVCSIGFIVQESNEIIHEEEILVNPKVEFSKRNIKIHNITEDDIIDSPTWPDAFAQVCEHITPSTLVIAHNLRSMELPCVRQECERYNIDVPEFAQLHNKSAYDTLKLSKELIPDIENYKLSTLAEKFDIELDHHNALSDAKACLELFNKLQSL